MGVSLRNDISFFAIAVKVSQMIGDAGLFDAAIRSFQKAEVVDLGKVARDANQTDVRSFRRFNRTIPRSGKDERGTSNPARSRDQTARPESREAALVGQLGQRIDLNP